MTTDLVIQQVYLWPELYMSDCYYQELQLLCIVKMTGCGIILQTFKAYSYIAYEYHSSPFYIIAFFYCRL